MNPNTKMIIDAAAGEALMGKVCDEAYELLEEMASNSYSGNQIERCQGRQPEYMR